MSPQLKIVMLIWRWSHYGMSVCTWQSRWQLEQVILCLLAVFFCSSEMKQATDPLPLLFSTKSCCLVAVKHDRCIINLSICCYGCIYMYMYHCLKTNFFFKNAIEKFCWVHVFTVTCHWACAEQNNRKFSQTATPPI